VFNPYQGDEKCHDAERFHAILANNSSTQIMAVYALGGQQKQNGENRDGGKIYWEVGPATGGLPRFDDLFFCQTLRQLGQLETWEGDSGGENHSHVLK